MGLTAMPAMVHGKPAVIDLVRMKHIAGAGLEADIVILCDMRPEELLKMAELLKSNSAERREVMP